MRKELFFALFLALILPFISLAQTDSSEYIITKKLLSVEDGLASREVLCGMQDSKGFIWFGTRNGLNRFDGKNFLLFTKQKQSMRANKVMKLVEDGNQNIWILYGAAGSNMNTLSKVDVLNTRINKIQPLISALNTIPFDESKIIWFEQIDKGEILIVLNNYEIWEYNSRSGFKKRFTYRGKSSIKTESSFFSKDLIMLEYYVEAPEFIFKDKFVEIGSQFGRPMLKKNNGVMFYKVGKKITDPSTTFIFNGKGEMAAEDMKLPRSISHNMKYDYSSNRMLFNQNDTVSLCDGTNYFYLLNKKENNLPENFLINDNFTDYSGNLWIISSAGVWKVSIKKNNFIHYFSAKQTKDKANGFNNQVRGIICDNGIVYANVWNRFCYANRAHPENSSFINSTEILYALAKVDNAIYTADSRVLTYNKQNQKLDIEHKNEFAIDEIWAIYKMNDSIMLEGGRTGIVKYNLKTGSSSKIDSKGLTPSPYYMYKFINEDINTTWALSELCLYKLNGKGEVTGCFSSIAKDSSRLLPINNLMDFHIDKEGMMWFTTSGEGLWRWDRKNNSFKQFTIADGLPTNLLYCLLEDKENNLWISSDMGLIRFNKNDFSSYTFTTDDGLSHNEFNRTSAYEAEDGRMFFGGLNGVNSFYPEHFSTEKNRIQIPLRITSVSMFSGEENKLIDKTNEYNISNNLVITSGDRFITIEFMLLDFEQGKKRYAYKIDGFNKDWNYTYENKISFSAIPYGKYNLLIKGQNAAGVWSSEELKIPLNFPAPFYSRLWFTFFVLSSFLILVFLIIRWRTQKLESENIKLENLISDRTEELKKSLSEKEVLLKEIHHRVKNNLQVVNSLFDMQSANIDEEHVKDILNEAKSRMRSIALIHHNLYQNEHLTGIEFHTFVADLCKQVASVFQKENQKIDFEFEIPKTYLDIDTAVPLGLIVNELLTNVFKYAIIDHRRGIVKLKLESLGAGSYRFIFTDNGKGMPEDFDWFDFHSMGLKLVQRLSKQLAGSVSYHYENGSVFTVKFKDTETRKQID